MHPRIYRILGILGFMLCCGLLFDNQPVHAAPQAGLDCRTASSGNWNAPATWETCGGGVPGAGDAAFIQAGHMVTLTQNAAVGDLHISTGTTSATTGGEGSVALGEYVLELYGKLHCYYAPINTTPITSTVSVHTSVLTMTPGSAGRLRVVGASRNLTESGEWGSGNSGTVNTFAIEIATDPNATIALGASVKAGEWSLVSGALDANNVRISADRGANGTGDVTIGANATLVSSASGATPMVSRIGSSPSGVLTLEGRLVVKGGSPSIGMTSFALNGVVEYAGVGQTLLRATAGGITPTVYSTLVVTNTGAKNLAADTTVTTRLVRGGTSSLALGANTLTYGPGAALEYAGTAAQATGPELPAAIGSLVIANSAGVTLSAGATVDTLLDLAAGDLKTGAYTLDLGAGATCSGAGDVVGAVRRGAVADGVNYCFGHPDVRAGVQAGSTPPSALTVTLTKGNAPFDGAVTRHYTVTAPGFAGVANLRLHYRADELNGNTPGLLHLWRYDGVRWLAQTPSTRGDGYVEKNDVTVFSDWAMADDGDSTAVDLSTFAAQAGSDQAFLTWSTGSEAALVGFHLHRATSVDGVKQRITPAMIPAQFSGQVAGAAYTWVDQTAALDASATFYWLEMVGLQGESSWHGPVEIAVARLYLPAVRR